MARVGRGNDPLSRTGVTPVASDLSIPPYSDLSPSLQGGPQRTRTNADMLPQERRLVESVFRREAGASVIVATPTLAQGMNLPAQVAILAGTKRHDDQGRQPLEAHEILNAAGRAGRAGHLANGLVLMIPEPVSSFSAAGVPKFTAFEQLRLLQPLSDRCVEILDPLTPILDRIHAGDSDDVQVLYVLDRIRAGELASESTDEAISLMRRSFGAFHAKQTLADVEFEGKLEALKVVLASDRGDTEIATIAASNGLPASVLIAARDKLQAAIGALPQDIPSWLDWLVDFLGSDYALLQQALSRDSGVVTYVVRGKKAGGPPNKQEYERLKSGLQAWIAGKPLSDIERELGVPKAKLSTCPRARDLVLKLANRSLYIVATAVADIAKTLCAKHSVDFKNMAVLETLGFALRRGFDNPEKVALAILRPSVRSRVQLHRQHGDLPGASTDQGGDFAAVVHQTNVRIIMEAFSKTLSPVEPP